ncbi:NUDIX hydrolase, core domain protein [mine drainage metagenome]|uniref:NUDIX hydrolase, core domain protein n=1 Tax=mine drainage metagenome TaxID=410659 RepID=T0ZQ84_9ZZZZ
MGETAKSWNGAYTCVFNKDFSEILLLWRAKESREGREIAGWGNIGGSIEPGETALQACIREMKEEIGIDLKPEDFTPVGVKKSPDGALRKWTVEFYAASIDGNTEIHLNNESRGYAWFGSDEIPDRTMDRKEELLGWWSIAKRNHAKSRSTGLPFKPERD